MAKSNVRRCAEFQEKKINGMEGVAMKITWMVVGIIKIQDHLEENVVLFFKYKQHIRMEYYYWVNSPLDLYKSTRLP